MPPTLSLVLPVHNQGDHIARVVRGFAVSLDRLALAYEIILVPNGSLDHSNGICRDLERDLPTVRCLEIAGQGWGRAVRSGIAEARGELICFTNAARTQPDDLSRIVAAALGNDGTVIKAVRVNRRSISRRARSRAFNLLCKALFGLRTTDVNGTPKAFPRTANALLSLRSDDDLLDLEFMWCCRRDNLQVIEIETTSDERHGGRSTTTWKTAVGLTAGVIRFWQQTRAAGFSR